MKKHFLLTVLAGLLLSGSLMASETIYPTLDSLYRIQYDEGQSKWMWEDLGGKQLPAGPSTFTTFECKWSSRLFAIQQYEIPNFVKAKTIKLILTSDGATAPVAIWNFQYEMPTDRTWDSAKRAEFTGHVASTTGKTINTTDGKFSNILDSANCQDGKWTITLDAAVLKPYAYDGTTAKVNILITTKNPNDGLAAKYKSNAESNGDVRPHIEVEYVDDLSLPVHEYAYRFKEGGWNSGFPKTEGGNTTFEANNFNDMYTAEQFVIEDFNTAKYYTLVLHKGGNWSDKLCVWDFNTPKADSKIASDIISAIKTASGADMSENPVVKPSTTPIAKAERVSDKWTFTIKGSDVTPIYNDDHKTVISLLFTNEISNGNKQNVYYTSHSDNANVGGADKRPCLKVAPIVNTTQGKQEATLAEAVSNANANDVITIYEDVAGPTSRLDIAKALTIQGATGAEKITCAVAANSIMILANGSGEHTLTFKNLVIDGNNVSRSIQTFEAAGDANICLDGVQFVNTSYSLICGDVKNTGNKNIVLKNTNSIPNGIYLNMNKRVDGQNATHATPIKLYLANDYVDDWVAVLCTSDPSQYEVVSADNSTGWLLEVSNSGSCGHELKAKHCLQYDLEVKAAAKMATMVIGFDAALPEGVRAYQLVYDDSPEYADGICAYEESVISKNKPVLIIAEPGIYSFKSIAGATLDEQANPTYGALKGVYASGNVPACAAGVYNYILTSGNDGVGFYQVADASNAIGAHRAYLSCGYNTQAGGGSAPRRMVINFDAHKTPTAVDQITNDQQPKAEKLLINGVLYIRKADRMYRIDGQLVK